MLSCGPLSQLSHACEIGRPSKDRMNAGPSNGSGGSGRGRESAEDAERSAGSGTAARGGAAGGGSRDEAEVDMEARWAPIVVVEPPSLPVEVVRQRQQVAHAESETAKRKAAEQAEFEEDRRAWEEEQAWLRSIDQPLPWHRRLVRTLFRRGPEPEVPPRRFLFACDLGDPISSIQLGAGGACMAGSVQGRIWILSASDGEGGAVGSTIPPLGSKTAPPPPRAELLAGWSDEGVRGLYIDEEHGYATFMESCRGWKRTRPHAQTGNVRFRDLERKNTQVVKHVLQRGAWVCVLFPLLTSLVHVVKRDLIQRQFKLFDFGSSTDAAPCDFDGETLLIVDKAHARVGTKPVFHLVHLETNVHTELDDIPDANWISVVKLWGPDCVAAAFGSCLHIYDAKQKRLRHTLRGHNAEILAVDSSDGDIIATLASDGVVKLWSGSTGTCSRTLCVPGAKFFLAYPYCVCMQDNKVAFSCDEGVYMIELGTGTSRSDAV